MCSMCASPPWVRAPSPPGTSASSCGNRRPAAARVRAPVVPAITLPSGWSTPRDAGGGAGAEVESFRATARRFGSGLNDHPGMHESLDLRRGNACGAQHLDGVLPDLRRECWWNLLLTADLEWARHGERGAGPRVVDWHQSAARSHLDIVQNVVERGDDAERDAGFLEDRRPRRPVLRVEPRVEDGGEDAGVGAPVVRRREARIGQEVLAADPPNEALPVTLVARDRQHEPAPVPAAVEVGQRADGFLAGRAHLGARPAENALHW